MAKRGRTGALVALALGAAAVWAAKDIPRQMGGKAKGDRLARVLASPQYSGGKFRNTVPASEVTAASVPRLAAAAMRDREARHPRLPIPLVTPTPGLDAEG